MNQFLSGLFGLTGRTAVVTGASSGIGREIAEALARAGARVVLIGRREDALRQVAQGVRAAGGFADWRSAELGDRTEVERVAEDASHPFGEPDILVNAAAVNIRPPLSELTPADWDRTLAVNLTAPFLLGQRFGPAMAQRHWGRIINIVSQQAIRAYGNSGAYGAAKAGLAGLTRSQAEAWSRRGVCVNAIAPGIVRTPMTAPLAEDQARWTALAERTLAGRNSEVTDFAGVAVFLASRAADYVTGQTIFVDGGFSVA
ncbi:MAG: dehydrogenase [Actinobacteria bacterium 13_2_20CM_2_71_6]|nr:MAG: dehydrogenase [Actinobacteria bacterium 13_2_20CM_2_71_6]